MDSTSNESSYDSSPNPARSQSRQARRDRWKQKRRRQSRSRARSDYRSISPQSKDTAHVRSRAERMDKDHNEIPDYNQDPIFPILRKKRYKIQSFWKSQRRLFFKKNAHRVCPTVCGGKGGVATLYPRGQLPGHLNWMHIWSQRSNTRSSLQIWTWQRSRHFSWML